MLFPIKPFKKSCQRQNREKEVPFLGGIILAALVAALGPCPHRSPLSSGSSQVPVLAAGRAMLPRIPWLAFSWYIGLHGPRWFHCGDHLASYSEQMRAAPQGAASLAFRQSGIFLCCQSPSVSLSIRVLPFEMEQVVGPL